MLRQLAVGLILFLGMALAIDIKDGGQLELKTEEGSLIGLGSRENDELELKVLIGVSGPLKLELRNTEGKPEVFSALLDDSGRLLVFELDTWVDLGELLNSKGIEFKLEREDSISLDLNDSSGKDDAKDD
ncbi:MAG: hypothetical protein KC422_17765 [Trueperaceae bacterium]|nr:hypothetical protein [Trueperaceae bacterium]